MHIGNIRLKRLEHLIKMDMALYKSYVLLLLLLPNVFEKGPIISHTLHMNPVSFRNG